MAVTGDRLGVSVRRAVIEGYERIVVGGGDGTIGTAARIVSRSDAVLGVLPLGTLNHFARDAGIPLDLGAAIRLALVGAPRRTDLASLNGRAFINNAVVGIYPRIVRARDWQRSRHKRPKYVAMALSGLQALRWFRTLPVAVACAGRVVRARTPLVFVGNNDYVLSPRALPRRDTLDQARLCLYLLRATSPWKAFLITCRVLLRGLQAERDLVHLEGDALKLVSPKRRLRVALDGEVAYFHTPLVFRSMPGELRVALPPAREAAP